MFQISKKLLSCCSNKTIYSNYVFTKLTNIINNIQNYDNSLKVIHNDHNEDKQEHSFIIGDNEYKKIYYGQIKVCEYIPQNFELVNNDTINKDDLMFEHAMALKNALKN
jgi:hypothetical protein